VTVSLSVIRAGGGEGARSERARTGREAPGLFIGEEMASPLPRTCSAQARRQRQQRPHPPRPRVISGLGLGGAPSLTMLPPAPRSCLPVSAGHLSRPGPLGSRKRRKGT
jgi:hypothetical protein